MQGVVIFMCVSAATIALLLTVGIVFVWRNPNILPGHWFTDPGLIENMLAGAVFFWLELLGIVAGARLLSELSDWFDQRYLYKKQLSEFHERLANLIIKIDDARFDFAVKLDKHRTPKGFYDTPLHEIEVCLKFFRDRFHVKELSNPELTSRAREVLIEVYDELERMTEQVYWAVDQCIDAMRRKDASGLDSALTRLFAECDVAREPGLLTIYDKLYDLRGLSRPT